MQQFLSKELVEKIKKEFPKGKVVEAEFITEKTGVLCKKEAQGKVFYVDKAGGIHLQWSEGGTRTLICGERNWYILEI